MKQTTSNLLRRTFALAGAVLAASLPAVAQKVQLYEGTGNTLKADCNYDEIKTLPNGSVRVNCTTTTTGTNGATFSVTGPTSMAPDTYSVGDIKVARSGGPSSGYYTVINYSVSGTGCPAADNPTRALPFYPGQTSWNIPFRSGAAGNNCTVSISGWTTPDVGSPSSLAITTTGGGGGGGPSVGGCPAPATNAVAGVDINLGVSYKDQWLKSGQIGFFKVPKSPNPAYTVKVEFTQGSTSGSPSANVTTEYLVSKCPGVIDEVKASVAAQCYQTGGATVYNKFPIATAAWTDTMVGLVYDGQEDYYQTCFAPNTTEDKYLNVRWTWINGPQTGSYTVQWIEAQSP